MAISRVSASTITQVFNPSITFTYSCSGTDSLLVVAVAFANASTATATYNGVSMTLANSQILAGSVFNSIFIFYLVNPSPGSNNVFINSNGSSYIWPYVALYNGVNQTNPVVPIGGATNQTTGSSITTSITTTVDNSWIYGVCQNGEIDTPVSVGSGATIISAHLNGWGAHFDTNSPLTPIGSKSVVMNVGVSNKIGVNMIAIAPTALASNTSNFFNFF